MLARADSHELKVSNRPIELAPIVEQVGLALAPASPRGTHGHRESVDELPAGLWAVGDADRLAQVLTNLVRNAINYTPEGGVVSIRLSDGSFEHVQIAVSDTGPGHLGRGPRAHLRAVLPRGQLARPQHGRVSVSACRSLGSCSRRWAAACPPRSQPGLGSTFWISLRRADPAQ